MIAGAAQMLERGPASIGKGAPAKKRSSTKVTRKMTFLIRSHRKKKKRGVHRLAVREERGKGEKDTWSARKKEIGAAAAVPSTKKKREHLSSEWPLIPMSRKEKRKNHHAYQQKEGKEERTRPRLPELGLRSREKK